jgi:hypothetical protein
MGFLPKYHMAASESGSKEGVGAFLGRRLLLGPAESREAGLRR